MKLNIRQLVLAFLLLSVASIQPKQVSAQPDEINFQIFYDALSPYGDWVDYQNYGYVWIPDVGPDFAPYATDGYWVLTDFGWTWVSDYEWGWAPFHYGRWDYDSYYGWLWVPDNEWGPSWVNWRRADGFYGWAPMQPGVSITLGFNSPYSNYNDHWMFVSDRDFERRDLYRYTVDRSRHDILVRNSTVINKIFIDNSRHTTYITGPTRADVQRATGRQISPVAIRDNERPGRDSNDGKLRMYRPQIVKNSGLTHQPAPARVEKLNNVKRPSERSGDPQLRELNQRNSREVRSTRQQETMPSDYNEQLQKNSRQPVEKNMVKPTPQPQLPPRQVTPDRKSEQLQQQNSRQQENKSKVQPSPQPQQSPRQVNPDRKSEQPQQQNSRQKENKSRVQPTPQPQQPPRQVTPVQKSEQQQNSRQQENKSKVQPTPQTPQQPQQVAPTRRSEQPRQQPQKATAPVNNEKPQKQNIAKPVNSRTREQESTESRKKE